MRHGIELAWSTVLKMVDGFFALLPNLLIAGLVFFVFYMISRFARSTTFEMATRAHIDRTLAHAMATLVQVSANVFGLLVCAVIVVPTFSPDKLIAGLGITSVAIGFAFQNILQNFFAGMLLLWQKPFGIGDEIIAKEFEGTVEDITIRTTLVRTHTGQRVYIPNGILFTDPVTVNTAFSQRQIQFQVALNDVPRDRAVEVARKALAKVPSIAKDPTPEIYVSFKKDVPSLDVYAWTDSRRAKMLQATDEAMSQVQQALRNAESDRGSAAA